MFNGRIHGHYLVGGQMTPLLFNLRNFFVIDSQRSKQEIGLTVGETNPPSLSNSTLL